VAVAALGGRQGKKCDESIRGCYKAIRQARTRGEAGEECDGVEAWADAVQGIRCCGDGDYATALQCLQKSFRMREALFGPTDLLTQETALLLADTYAAFAGASSGRLALTPGVGLTPEVVDLWQAALKLRIKLCGESHPEVTSLAQVITCFLRLAQIEHERVDPARPL